MKIIVRPEIAELRCDSCHAEISSTDAPPRSIRICSGTTFVDVEICEDCGMEVIDVLLRKRDGRVDVQAVDPTLHFARSIEGLRAAIAETRRNLNVLSTVRETNV